MSKKDHPNKDICDMLNKLGEYERDVNGIIHKYYAYRKAIKALEMYDKRVESGAEAQKLNGIGPKIAQKIDDFLQNGEQMVENEMKPKEEQDGQPKQEEKTPTKKKKESSQQEKGTPNKKVKKQNNSKNEKVSIEDDSNNKNIENDNSTICDDYLLSEHYKKLYKMSKLDCLRLSQIEGLRTIGDLKKRKHLLSEPQKVCLEHFHELCETIPRKEIRKYEKFISKWLDKLNNENILKLNMEICGEYRRNLSDCDSIDVLFINLNVKSTDSDVDEQLKKTMKTIVKCFVTDEVFKKKISLENRKFVSLVRMDNSGPHRLMNMNFVCKDEHVCSLLHLTGSEQFYEKIREHSINNGFILNETSLCRIGYSCVPGIPIKLKNEKELFDFINHPFVEPENRNDVDDN